MHACTQMSGISLPSPPQTSPGPKPCSPHFNEATAIFHHGRCVAVATRPSHLLIPYWVCIYRLSPLPYKPVNHTFVSSLPSDWFVPLMPSFKVLTFIYNWLPNDNEEKITCTSVGAWERQWEIESIPVAWLRNKPWRLRRCLKPAPLDNNALVENGDHRKGGLGIFVSFFFPSSPSEKKNNTKLFSAPKSHDMTHHSRRSFQLKRMYCSWFE